MILSEARYLNREGGRLSKDKRLKIPPISISPQPNAELFLGNGEGLPIRIRNLAKLYRVSVAAVGIMSVATFLTFVFG